MFVYSLLVNSNILKTSYFKTLFEKKLRVIATFSCIIKNMDLKMNILNVNISEIQIKMI